VVGTRARILYQDAPTRVKIALAFNKMVRNGVIGPVMIGRDHMDCGAVDAPSRETSNIKDGSNLTSDQSHLVFGGDATMGMTLLSMHNGGGTGIGNSHSCGYGLLLDGSMLTDSIIQTAIRFDVLSGVARRAWARNENALSAAREQVGEKECLTLPYICDDEILRKTVGQTERQPK